MPDSAAPLSRQDKLDRVVRENFDPAALDNPRGLRLTTGPAGALPGCPGQIELYIERNNCGSWSTACSMDLALCCEAKGCWWSRTEWTGAVDADLFTEAAIQHAIDAGEGVE